MTLDRVFLNSLEVPISAIWTNSKAKRQLDEIQNKRLMSQFQQASGQKRRADKPVHSPNDRNKLPKTGDKSGWIKCTGPNLSLPTELFNKDYKMCKSCVRDGATCQMGALCKKDHSSLAKLPVDKQNITVKHVDADSKLSFVNVDAKLLAEIRAR